MIGFDAGESPWTNDPSAAAAITDVRRQRIRRADRWPMMCVAILLALAH